MIRTILYLVLLAPCLAINSYASPTAPTLTLIVTDLHVQASWTAPQDATGFELFYAPYPSANPIRSLDMGTSRSFDVDLPASTAYYVAVQAYNEDGNSGYSNIEYFDLSTEAERLVFTSHLFELDKISHIYPLGQLNGGHFEAASLALSLIQIKPSVIEAGDKVAVYAPADMSLELYGYGYGPVGDQAVWILDFKFNEQVSIRYSSVTEVVQAITDVTTSTPNETSEGFPPSSPLSFNAGNLIGYTTGTVQANNWDIWVYDKDHQNTFARPSRYEVDELGDRLKTAVCPYSFLNDTMKAEVQALYGINGPGETIECGTASRDVVGTLAGQWHFDSDPTQGVRISEEGNYASPLAVFNNLNDEVIIHSVNSTRYQIPTSNPTYKKPEDIVGSHCYDLSNPQFGIIQGYIYFNVLSDIEVQVFFSATGICPDNFPTSGFKAFYR